MTINCHVMGKDEGLYYKRALYEHKINQTIDATEFDCCCEMLYVLQC